MKTNRGKPAVLPSSLLILAAAVSGLLGGRAHALVRPVPCTPQLSNTAPTASISPRQPAQTPLPDAPRQSSADQQPEGSIYGTVTDPSGDVVVGAEVTLQSEPTGAQQSLPTDNTGFFAFTALASGAFRISVSANGFADWSSPDIILSAGRYYDLPEIVLTIAPASTDVNVVFTRHDLAEEQIQAQEKQRILGVIPNFYTSYLWHAVPLTSGQKFRLALRSSVDPVTFAVDGATAGIEQWQNDFSGYGQGAAGYAKRFGAVYADDFIGTMIGSAILPSVLHQDPRYFYKGVGSVPSRALYAISTVVICRSDDGRREPNYSNILGNLAAAEISNLYYPASSQNGAGVTIDNALIGTAEGAVSALLQEFIIRKISRGVHSTSNSWP